MLALVIVVAVLYLAREVLIPLALAILFSFVLAPVVRRLERWHLGRVAVDLHRGDPRLRDPRRGRLGGDQPGALARRQAARVPPQHHPEDRRAALAADPSDLGKATEAIKELDKQTCAGQAAAGGHRNAGHRASARWSSSSSRSSQPLATALAVIVFTILMLLNRENMRERLIGLIGAGRINLTTQALNEVGDRVGRYLYMQLVVNALFGIPFGIALYFIGIPNALLWGLLATLLRFIPYAGVWIAVVDAGRARLRHLQRLEHGGLDAGRVPRPRAGAGQPGGAACSTGAAPASRRWPSSSQRCSGPGCGGRSAC